MNDKELKLQALAQETYLEYGRLFRPARDRVLVRVLPKSQQYGSLILPGKQNKTVWEGIVLATFRPYEATVKSGARITINPVMQVGEHVVFPHYVGAPIPGLKEDLYRTIREDEIHAVLEYEDTATEDKLTKLLRSRTTAIKLMKQFTVIDNEQESKTMSGA